MLWCTNSFLKTTTTNDPFNPLFEITNYPDPPGVLFGVHGTHANQLRSHAGHTSVTQALTKVPESLESMEITLRCEAIVDHCFHCEKWCPGADSNHRHADFQSAALPTELPGRAGDVPEWKWKAQNRKGYSLFTLRCPDVKRPARQQKSKIWTVANLLLAPALCGLGLGNHGINNSIISSIDRRDGILPPKPSA